MMLALALPAQAAKGLWPIDSGFAADVAQKGTKAEWRAGMEVPAVAEVSLIMNTNGLLIFNVEKYGALPDTDSTTAIRAAIAAAIAAGGGEVYCPRQRYLTSDTIHFTELVQFSGRSGSANYGYTISNTTGSDVLVGTGSIYNYTMRNMSLAAPESPTATNAIIRLSANSASGFGLAKIESITTKGGRFGMVSSNLFTSEIKDTRFLGSHVGAHFTGAAVGRILIDGGGAGSGAGIGYLIDQGTYFVFDGVDMGATTNMVKVNVPAFVTIQNCNLEGGLASSDATVDTGYIKFHSANSGGLLRTFNTRFGAGNGSPLTLSYSIAVSNALNEVGGGNTFSHAGPTGQSVEEWGTIPCPTYVTNPENYGSQLWVTNRTSNVGRKPRQYMQDLQNSGRSAFFSSELYHGAVWYDSRASGASDALYYHIKLANNTYHGVDVFEFYKRTKYLHQLGVGTNAFTGYSGASSQMGIDSSARWLMVGSDNNATTRTDATFKSFGFTYPPYNTARGPVIAMTGYAGDAGDGAGRQNRVTFGGGTSAGDASTILDFNTGALDATSSTTKLRITGSGVYSLTNFHSVAIAVTNFIAMPTNYVAANFVPVSGMVKLVTSNDWMYSVTLLATNRAFQINP